MKALKVIFCVLIIVFISSQTLHAQTASAPGGWVAQLVSVEGSAQLKKAGEAKWSQARLNDKLYPGDMLRVMDKSRAAVVMSNQSNVRLDENTTLTFKGVEEEKTILLDIFRGAAHFFNRVTRTLKIFTPYVNGIVQGTEFLVKVDDKEALISIFEGRIAAENDKGSIIVNGGQTVIARAGEAPMLMAVVKPRDAVQWALYYPSIMDFRPEDFSGTADWQDKTRKSVEAYRKGDIAGANEALKDLKDEGVTDTRYLTYRATLALSVGRLEEASAYLERTIKAEPNNANAYALQSVIAVVQNRKDDATNLARKATSLDPKSSAALIAQSYAQQARFDINGATASVQEAVKNSPNDAYARARLAELWLSQGYLDRALAEANRAVTINSNLARTQMVLGYAYLTQVNIKEAIDAFEKSITLNSADPLARLGLGLAKIRKGDLEEGRKDIEIAASLDVNNSLIRSYLGKAYYEEKRDRLSATQFGIAKQLDPMDPTPWFYDAILKQSVNRPVEALQDMQKSIELNDNRAVYRSQLLLDEDLAARSAGVGRIFNDLGFQQRALVEGWKSLNVDPGNFSAHRFLSDSYISLPRREIARVSELLQSQLRQPININPVQPQLAESSSTILEGSGPSSAGFNEYDSLFNRNRVAMVANGVWGKNSTLGDEVTVSGVYDRLSISAGQMYYKTDGFRDNDDLQKNIYNIFAQFMISPETSVLAEFRYSNDKRGDRFLRFDPADYYIPRRIETIDRYYRLGLRHAFSPNSDLIAVVTYLSQDWNFRDRVDGMAVLDPTIPIIAPMTMDFREKADTGAYLIEVQHLLKWSRFKVISGGGYFDSDAKNYSDADITIDGFPLPTDSIFYRTKFDHTNIYSYTLTTFPDNVTWTIGASGDFAHSDVVDREQFNPKFGVTWNPFASTTVRGAAFRVLKRSLLANQTLEPTQVAGFNQFFDDYTGTEAWTYGVGLDQAFTKNLFGGIEGTRRDLKVPYQTYDDMYQQIVKKTDWDEEAFRAYLYWAPLDWVSLQGEYMHEHFKRSSDSGMELFTSIFTNKCSLGVNFFHPLGFFARLKSTYIDQEGDFQHLSFEPYSGSDNFWVFDAAVGYRLPKRLGMITIEARNFTNQKFNFQDTDPANPQFIPESFIFTRLTLNF